MRLVYLSPVPWESFAQRPHKFVHWAHSRTRKNIFWIDPYPTRFPRWSDFRRPPSTTTTGLVQDAPSWLKVLKPGGFPIEPLPGSALINRQFWRPNLSALDECANDSSTLLVIGKPSVLALELLERFFRCPSLYDAMDDFPAFYAGLSRIALARREQMIARRVDIIWASSSKLKIRWEGFHNDVRLVHNGLDLSVMPAMEQVSTKSTKRIFGYVGTIGSWFDWDWIRTLAESRPSDEIRLIGPVFEPPKTALPGNVAMLPACDHGLALKSMLQFDVGLIPFKSNALTASVDPIKYYEYRALALPVISTDFGEMHFRSDVPGVFVSRSLADMPSLAEAALRFNRDSIDNRLFASQNSWEARFDAAGPLPAEVRT
ncbi:glycosyltransferase [Allochromatium vinosum DSM 180]|uniref:Glycosyltransferase n=1 Tax=Allochromatium vinosum (strain ATCC 17899 / DSM 180 / NBRC 103801 / NCIMB 10441 / D) TaxID=572477 RepID=D3RVP8_ALLVD|nr:glycosyltransferase [Allochromatium vinosum DSM 180]